ncbi:putative ATPase [Sphingomonas naasensis]|uniref:ATPase n=1 Tax=Sphingomonas naasensis TaxID=1344951 RepID=A0A4S1WUU9_9SPHN|nr:AAA family ATPase [Sphingomonas naasensis]NIJ18931.1 putative ATPase [Sphingomonas naasensis]TGX46147.1 ATPase [Sphingomonas naasensis]
MNRFVAVSGCSGGGKSTLIDALAARGFATVPEPGRRIVGELRLERGEALPWVDLAAFARRAIAMAIEDRAAAEAMPGWVFFDRGVVDAAVALAHATGEDVVAPLARAHRYHRRVFLAPPWPEIWTGDSARLHDLGDAEAEYARLAAAWPALGYEVQVLPRTSVAHRVEWMLAALGAASST